jgi:hypothetical protein
LREEKLKWFQRAKTTKILKGDNNTKYFQMELMVRGGKLELLDSGRRRGGGGGGVVAQIYH